MHGAAGLLALCAFLLPVAACSAPAEPPEAEPGSGPQGPPADMDRVQWGEWLFVNHGCAACHHINGIRGAGGALDGVFGAERTMTDGSTVTADEAYLRRAILAPDAQVVEGFEAEMPSYEGILNDAQVDALVAYLRSLQ